jgi:pimeloyl-ACP methyl ester carboxylesterase
MIAARLTTAMQDLQRLAPVRKVADLLDAALEQGASLQPALDARRHRISTSDAGVLSYYEDKSASGRPLVLLHGVHAAASSYEMKPLFDYFRSERPVYALDLPGFGFSERAARAYSPATYVHAIEHLLRNVSSHGPVDVIALSLSSEYLAKEALEMPELVRSLVLISPTGFASDSERGWLEKLSRQRARLLPTELVNSLPSRLLYELIVSKPSIRYFLRKSFQGEVDAGMLRYAHLTSHQPGAHHAPMSFLSGALFPRGEASNIYAHVRVPALVLYDQDNYTGFSALPAFAEAHHNYRLQRVTPTRGLPHFDAPEQTIEAIRLFLEEQDQRRAPLRMVGRPASGPRNAGSA